MAVVNKDRSISHRRVCQKTVKHNRQVQKGQMGNLLKKLPVLLVINQLVHHRRPYFPVICKKIHIKPFHKAAVLTALQDLPADIL